MQGVGWRRQLALDFLFAIVPHDENSTVYGNQCLARRAQGGRVGRWRGPGFE
jgi:hypothetical protein